VARRHSDLRKRVQGLGAPKAEGGACREKAGRFPPAGVGPVACCFRSAAGSGRAGPLPPGCTTSGSGRQARNHHWQYYGARGGCNCFGTPCAIRGESTRVQSGESSAEAGIAEEDRQLASDESTAMVGKDWRPVGKARTVLRTVLLPSFARFGWTDRCLRSLLK
jgi:hypothetical protein